MKTETTIKREVTHSREGVGGPSEPRDGFAFFHLRGMIMGNFGHVALRVGKESSAVMIWGPASIGELKDMTYALREYFKEC
jgi:hypothetical protein